MRVISEASLSMRAAKRRLTTLLLRHWQLSLHPWGKSLMGSSDASGWGAGSAVCPRGHAGAAALLFVEQPEAIVSGAVISSPAQREQLFSWCLENTLSSSTVTA